MKIPKPTEDDRERFTELVPDAPHVEVKPMFGNLGAFVNGNMFMGLFGSDVGIKLPEDDQHRLLEEPGAGPFGPEERPMAGYVTIPADWSTGHRERLDRPVPGLRGQPAAEEAEGARQAAPVTHRLTPR
jgi:TfoX/Sxy family transcriptional regulator of competence genes